MNFFMNYGRLYSYDRTPALYIPCRRVHFTQLAACVRPCTVSKLLSDEVLLKQSLGHGVRIDASFNGDG